MFQTKIQGCVMAQECMLSHNSCLNEIDYWPFDLLFPLLFFFKEKNIYMRR